MKLLSSNFTRSQMTSKKLIRLAIILFCILVVGVKLFNGFSQKPKQVIPIEDLVKDALLLSASTPKDFVELTQRCQLYKKCFNILHSGPKIQSTFAHKMLQKSMSELEKSLFPIPFDKYPSVKHLLDSFKGRGIVMSTGNWHYKYARHAILTIRLLGCKLPIQVFYLGPGDLEEKHREELRTFQGVEVIDLKARMGHFKNVETLGGWAAKPAAMLFSDFKEIIFMDADCLFFQNPETLFDWKLYKETGSVYFRDRTIHWKGDVNVKNFFKKFVPNPSEYANNGRLIKEQTVHEAESGVIIMDKSRGGLFVLLMTTLMNMEPLQQIMYKVIHGDKESYWMASEALNIPYSWAPGGGGTLGYPNPDRKNSICGGLSHTDEQLKPLWFNGGIYMNKHTEKGRVVMPMTHWATDVHFEDVEWDWENETRPFCLKPKDPASEIGALTSRELVIAKDIVKLWNEFEEKDKAKSNK